MNVLLTQYSKLKVERKKAVKAGVWQRKEKELRERLVIQ